MRLVHCADLSRRERDDAEARIRACLDRAGTSCQEFEFLSATTKSQVAAFVSDSGRRLIAKRHTQPVAFLRERLAYAVLLGPIPQCATVHAHEHILVLEDCRKGASPRPVELFRLGQDLAALHSGFDKSLARMPASARSRLVANFGHTVPHLDERALAQLARCELGWRGEVVMGCSIGDMKLAHYLHDARVFIDFETFRPGWSNFLDIGMLIVNERLDDPTRLELCDGYYQALRQATPVYRKDFEACVQRAIECFEFEEAGQ